MKKHAMLSIFLAAALIMGGCNGADASAQTVPQLSGPMGRYVETDITPPREADARWSRTQGLHIRPDGTLDYLCFLGGPDTIVHYRSSDRGETWETVKAGWQEEVNRLCGREAAASAANLDLDDDGNIYTAVPDENGNLRLFRAAPEGGVTELPAPETWNGRFPNFIDALRITPGGNIGLWSFLDGSQTALYDGAAMKEIARAGERAGEWAAFTDSQVVTVEDDELVFRGSSGEQRRTALPHFGEELVLEADRDGAVMAVTHAGVDCIGSGAAIFERLIDGTRYTFGNPNRGISMVRCGSDGALYMALDDGASDRLFRYTLDPGVPLKPDTQLDVFSLSDSVAVRAAIIAFQAENPAVAIRYQVADDSPLEKNGRQALEGALEAGKGPDVILLDGLDWKAYVKKGWLARVTLPKGCLENVAESGMAGGALYAVPTRFVPWLEVDNGSADPYLQVSTGLEGLSYTLTAMGQNADPAARSYTLATMRDRTDPAAMKGFYQPASMLGITASGRRALAQAFVETMLSESVQTESTGDGFPVRESALRKWLAEDSNKRFAGKEDGLVELCKRLPELVE